MILSLIIAAAVAPAPNGLAQSAFEPWASFVGHCWTGPAPGRGTDTHCFEAVYGGQHLRDRHEVKVDGKIVYAGETVYSVVGKDVVFTYWNSIGGLGTGKASVDGSEMHFSGEARGTPEGRSEPFTALWVKVDGGYLVTDEGRQKALFKRYLASEQASE